MAQAEQEMYEPEEVKRLPESKKQELEERAGHGETVVHGGTGGKSLEAQIHLAEGRHKGGEHRKEELGHEGYKELGHKGGTRRGGRRRGAEEGDEEGEEEDEDVEDKEVYTPEEAKRLPEWKKKELDERARASEVVIAGGTGGKSLEAQIHLAKGRHKGGEHRKEELGHEGYKELGHKGGARRRGRRRGGEEGDEEGEEEDEDVEDKEVYTPEEAKRLPEWKKKELDERARAGEVVIAGGTGGKSLGAQIHLAEGRHKGGHARAKD